MANTRHVVVIRRDLNLSRGLEDAQVAHICDAWLRRKVCNGIELTSDEKEWCKTPYLTVLSVDNKEELIEIIDMASRNKLQCEAWHDLIPSVNLNKNLPDVLIGCSIGPADFDAIKAVTGTLPLA